MSSTGDPIGSAAASEAGNADDAPDVLLPLLREATEGEYEIERELGRGGMAAVYLARDIALNRKVAIKTMLSEFTTRASMVQRFKREAQMAAGLSHPHIIQIHCVGDRKRLVYFVMKFIEGRSLDSIINDRGALDLDAARLILQQAGSALSFAHHRGVIHRDVKPANIMIDENGWAVVTDFGIAKVDDVQGLTATGTTMGTPHYMSPEQFHNKPATGASDQYSLGIVAYEMLTGKKPFDGGSLAEVVTKQLFNDPPNIREDRPDLPPEVGAAITRMLAKEPAERFPDLDSAIAALGRPSADNVDTVRAHLMSIARSAEQKKPRLSVPMSPVPITRPSAPTAVLSSAPKPPGSQSPKAPIAPTIAEAPAAAPVARKRRYGLLWAGAAVVVLAVAAWFVAPNLRFTRAAAGGRSAALDRGTKLWQQGQREPARAAFAQAAREMPRSALPHVFLARIARESGNLDLARQEASRAVQLESTNGAALRELGMVMLATRNYPAARNFFIRAVRANPSDRASMGWLSCSLEKLGQTQQAATWRQRAGPSAAVCGR